MIALLIAAVLFEANPGGIEFKVESETKVVDPARSVFLTVTAKAKPAAKFEMPDLRDRVVGFSLAEDFAEEPRTETDGRQVQVVNWRLVPEPCAEVYKIKPFVVGPAVGGPIYFENPPPREPVTGAMEVEVSKDLPPLSWKLVGWICAALLALGVAVVGCWMLVKLLVRKVKEHRMSPIERAWVELDRLLKKGLPGRGRYKDFYVELTMVVRRYVQRQHGVSAPHLTTEEFFEATRNAPSFPKSTLDELIDFLRKADMVKFAGVEATPETADGAVESARTYISKDDLVVVKMRTRNHSGSVTSGE